VFDLPDATVNVLQGILFISILFSETFYGRSLKELGLFKRRPKTAPTTEGAV
jgi:hypothetical protein